MIVDFVTARDNFLFRATEDGKYKTHTDVVVRITSKDSQFRIVVPAGSVSLKKVKRGMYRWHIIKDAVTNLPIKLRDKDDIFLAIIKEDNAKNLIIHKLARRFRGYLVKLWKY